MNTVLRRAPHALLLAGGAALALIAACGPAGGGLVPTPDTCATPQSAAIVDTLELGLGADGAFRPLADGDVITLARGGQGNQMFPVRLRITGGATPSCLDQKSEVLGTNGGSSTMPRSIALADTPLATYAEGASRTTHVLYLVLFGYAPSGAPLLVRAEAGGKTVERSVWVDSVGNGGLPRTDGGR